MCSHSLFTQLRGEKKLGCKAVYSVELSEGKDSINFINLGKTMRLKKKETFKHYIILTSDRGAKKKSKKNN